MIPSSNGCANNIYHQSSERGGIPLARHVILLGGNKHLVPTFTMSFDGTKRKQTIYVGGLHEESNESELIDVFSAFGENPQCCAWQI